MGPDLHLWPVATAPTCEAVPRAAFQLRRRLLMPPPRSLGRRRRGAGLGLVRGDLAGRCEALPWSAHLSLYATLEQYADHVRYDRGLGGVARLEAPREQIA